MRQRKQLRKHLTRSASNRVIAGVFGGFGAYWNINPNPLRIVYLILTVLTSFVPGIIIYLMMAVLIPADPNQPTTLRDLLKMFGSSDHQTPRADRKELHDVEEKDL
ncbi:PspC domain-containing protein [Limosilactobacillus caecicola]|uniref:PspC domain-containing protein n=1 Tax=Limosilactobacillus caecicola TaxID=2941332 RepID=UPI00203BDD63|nr:PspC domain-containing protein [Limosilactobacillus caecicola]